MPYLVFLIGLMLGSFANVVIVRWPKGESFVKPRSHCPSCKKPVYWYDKLPVISWIFLRARCRHCGILISWRYPFVELLIGALFLTTYLLFGTQWVVIEYLIFMFGLV